MTPDDYSALAGEYVLGLLHGEALAEAEALRVSDAAFAAAVMMWEMRLISIAEAVPPVAPPGRIWDQLVAATQPARPRPAAKFLNWRRGVFGAGLALAGAAALVIYLNRPQPPPSRELASLSSAGGGVFVVTESAGTMAVAAENISLPAGKTAELWIILPGHAPLAAGLLANGQSVSNGLPAGVSSMVLAVTAEPAGGSPTGGPTGPVIAEGKITQL